MVAKLFKSVGWLRRSSMLRLSLLLSGIFAVGMAIAIFVAITLGQSAIERRVDTSLTALAGATILAEVTGDSPSMIMRGTAKLQGLPRPFSRAVDRGGGTIELDDDFLRSDIWRVLVTRDSNGQEVMVAVPLEESEQAQELLAGVLWTTTLVVILITIVLGLIAGLLAQRRLVRVRETLERLAGGDLAARTGHARSRDDLDDIAGQVDQTAQELEKLVAQTRHLSASLAHDLRTPLARLRSRLEMLPQGEARSDALEEANRMAGIFDTIMRVARIEAGQGREGFENVSLRELIEELEETFGPVVEDEGKTLKATISEAGTVVADRPMLVQAMANLIQNALVHGGDEITLIAKGRSIGVADNGRGVDPADYAEIVKPMVRLDSARSTEGTGLGLALVRAVTARHGAQHSLAPLNAKAAPAGLRVLLNFANL